MAGVGLALVSSSCGTVREPVLPPAWPVELAAAPLSVDDCIGLALRSTPNAAVFAARAAAARAQLAQAGALPNPGFDAGWEDFGIGIGHNATPVQQTFSLAFSLADLLSRGRRRAAAQHDFDAELADLEAERQKVADAVAGDYARLAWAHERVALAVRLEAIATADADAMRRFVEAGIAPRRDAERAAVERDAAADARLRAEAELRTSELGFAFALGFERPVALALGEGLEPPQVEREPLGDLLAKAAQARPELAAATARYRAELERAHLAADRLRFVPSVTFGGRTQGGETRAVGSLGVELPVFDAGGAAVAAADAALLSAAARLHRAAHAVAAEVNVASAALDGALAQRTRAQQIAAQRGALRQQAERLFAAGQLAYSDVLQARRDEVTAASDLLEARLGVATQSVRVRTAIGGWPVPSPLASERLAGAGAPYPANDG